jgi:hypothetical protein
MPPAVIGGAIAAGGAIAGGVAAANASQNATNSAASLAQQASAGLQNVDIPTIQSQVLQLQQIQNAGQLTPQQEATLQQGQSILNSYQQSQPAMQAQMQALSQLQSLGQQGGLTPTMMAQLNQVQTQINNQNASNNAAIQQGYAQRGMAGSGTQLAAQLAANQGQLQAASTQGFNVAAQAQQNALQAIQGAGQLGSGLEAENFGEASQKAQAQNAINQFNTANAQNVLGQNVARNNYAQQYNLSNQQQLNQANTSIANQQQVYNQGLQQQNFNNQMAQQTAVANALNKQGSVIQQGGQNTAGIYSGIGQAGAKLGTSIMNYNPNSSGSTSNNGGSQYNSSENDTGAGNYTLPSP